MIGLAGVGIVLVTSLSLVGYGIRKRRQPRVDVEAENKIEVIVDDPADARPITMYMQWAEDCRSRVGIVGPIVNDVMSVGNARVSRLHFALDTDETLNVWIDGPEWLGPFPRVSKTSWSAKEHLVVAQDDSACFEQTLLLARGCLGHVADSGAPSSSEDA